MDFTPNNEDRDMLPMESDDKLAAFSSAVFQINVEKGTKTFLVHGDILSRHSEPFKSIVNGNWEESAKREINMEEWDAETISRMIDYLYTGDYTWQMDGKFKPIPIEGPGETPIAEISKFVEGRPLTPLQEFKRYSSTSSMSYDAWSSFHGTEQGFEKLLLIHAKVYALAHYRAIEKLSKLALDRLMQTLLLLQPGEFNLQKIGCIVELVAYVYENTCLRLGKPEAMRQAVTRFIGLEITRLNPKGEISKLMGTYGDFADDLLADLIRRIKFSEVNCVIKHKYIAGIEVHVGYPQPPNCMQEYHWGSPNINEWKSCEPVWLVPYYTDRVDKACTSFEIVGCYQIGYDHRFRIPTTSGPSESPCLISVCDKSIRQKVTHVQLVRVRDMSVWETIQQEFQQEYGFMGKTNILENSGSSSEYLFLMWGNSLG